MYRKYLSSNSNYPFSRRNFDKIQSCMLHATFKSHYTNELTLNPSPQHQKKQSVDMSKAWRMWKAAVKDFYLQSLQWRPLKSRQPRSLSAPFCFNHK